MKKHYSPHLAVAVGDLVRVEFTCPTRIHLVRVAEVERRYGKVNGGRYNQNPLVIGLDTSTNERLIFDACFAKEIKERRLPNAAILPRKNIFREAGDIFWVSQKGNQWTGTLRALAIRALADLPYEFDRPLDEIHLAELYAKSGLGCKGWNYPAITVNKNLFCRWISKNYSRIVTTSKKHHSDRTEELIAEEMMLEADLDRALADDESRYDNGMGIFSDLTD